MKDICYFALQVQFQARTFAYNESMFVHLRLHTEFSVVDSTNRIETLVNIAKKDGQPALAITDLNNLFGAIKFYKEARANGLKPILG